MFKIVILSCALTASLGNYAGKKVDTPISIPKVLNPNNPIDPSSVRPVGPGLRPGDVITPIQIDNVRGGPGDLQWIDENPINPFGNAQNPFVDQNLVAKPLDITGGQGQVFQNPFSGGQGTSGGIIRKKPSYDGSHKGPVPPSLKKLPGYTGPAVGSDYPPPTGVIKPDAVDYPQKGILDQSGVLPGGNPFGNPNYDGPGFAPEVSPFGPFTGGIVDPLDQVNGGIVRKPPSYDNSHKILEPPVQKPTNYDGPEFAPEVSPFGPFTGGIVDPLDQVNGGIVRKPPSYDNSHKILEPPVKKPTNYDGPGFAPEVSPFRPFTGGIVDPLNQVNGGIVRKPPSYDNSHKILEPPVQKPTNYDGPGFAPEVSPFGPFTGGIVDPLDQVNGGIRRKAPSYDNSHKLLPGQVIGGDTLSPIIPPRKPPSYDNSNKLLPGQVIGGPGQIIGGDPFNPIIPPRKPPSYDNSHKLQPGQVIGGDPARKAPSYDNSHKLGLGGEIPPVIPGSGYVKPPSVPGLSLPGGPRPGDVIDPFSLEAQQQQFDELVSARLGARSGISPPSLPVQKKLSAGKRNYLSSLGVFKKAKSYES
uniref:Proline-rich extensin-like protein EPR1 isoform X1 n=1 Tax=Crassostrea virginica TaxID=6565 RepID=A0A8B8DP19_CRAVI|nr:proline-rich extensin-like protein EPR1 isoform X1 [Crassostrea virginica]